MIVWPTMRALVYLWALPTTLLGLPFVLLAPLTGGRLHWHTGVLELSGGAAGWWLRCMVPLPGGASALTLGHIVLGRCQATLARTRRHERVHVRQVERWGPLFVPAYLLCSLWLLLRRRDAYRENPFEAEAFAVDDGRG